MKPLKALSICSSLCTSASLLLLSDMVHAITGKVTDLQGKPIKGAIVTLVDNGQSVTTDEQGGFGFPRDKVDELHVAAKGFRHKILHLHQQRESATPLAIQLMASAIEQVDVVGLPLHVSTLTSVQPVSVLTQEDLVSLQQPTLGETLKQQVGVHSSYFGPIASSPIIRGLDGPRVLVTQNNLDIADASRIGSDHVVTGEAATAQQIEILRGPSTLFYGSGAIGGVVNVVDHRVPQRSQSAASFTTFFDTVADESNVSGIWHGGTDSMAFHADGFWRDGDNYDIPGRAERDHGDEGSDEEGEAHSDEESGVLENSAINAKGINLGASYLMESGFVGLSFGRMERLNGIPGHGHEEDEGDPTDIDDAADEVESAEEEVVESDLSQNRWQLHSELNLGDDGLWTKINTRFGYSDYEHQEIENGESGTTFKNDTWEGRVDVQHRELWGWRGALLLDYKRVDFSAQGEEAFTPPSITDQWALALLEEKHVTQTLLLQLGVRAEQVELSADDLVSPEGLHEEGDAETPEIFRFDDLDFTPISLSAGAVWEFTEGYNASISLSRAERAPNAAEIFSLGPHVGTRTFEIGALFSLNQDGDETEVEFTGRVTKEVSNNVDVGIRKTDGVWGFAFNAFYNDIDDFYFLSNTGLSTEDVLEEHDEDDDGAEPIDDEDEHGHGEEILPVFTYRQADARLFGFELSGVWKVSEQLHWSIWGDYVRAKLTSEGDLPRIPPARLGTALKWQQERWNAQLSANHYFDQNRVADFETSTDGYTLIDVTLNVDVLGDPSRGGTGMTVFLQGMNLDDTDARVHSSFIKDEAPLPGRNIRLGLRAKF